MKAAPRCGGIYRTAPSRPGRPDLRGFVVLSENDWNDTMQDSVVVPIYGWKVATASALVVNVGDSLWADCTKVISFTHEGLGEGTTMCPEDPWVRIRLGVRRFLDIDRRITKGSKPAISTVRTAWWPRQDDVHLGRTSAIPERKLYAALSDDDWNSQPTADRAAFTKLASKTEEFRKRWEVPVSGGWVVCGDIYQLLYTELDPSTPPDNYPSRLTDGEAAALAKKQKTTLTL